MYEALDSQARLQGDPTKANLIADVFKNREWFLHWLKNKWIN